MSTTRPEGRDVQFARLQARIEASGGEEPGDDAPLDDLVHDLKSREASQINNEGLESQLAYILDRLGPDEAAEEVARILGDTAPDDAPGGAAPARERTWEVTYQVCDGDGRQLSLATVTLSAATRAEAIERAVGRVHDHDPSCDARIDYRVEVMRVVQAQIDEADDDEPDDPSR
jgi:hypothetical protein